jgi:CubicO group peptidase (beta-lactamase class C family)
MRRRILALSVLALALPCRPAAAQGAADAATASRLDSLARAYLASAPTPGLAVFVLQGDDTLLLRGYGFADLEDSTRATPRTVFRIGSITKQFTAALVMQLVQEGRIALDDTIQKFLPDFPAQGHRVTIRHLLTHTSGIKSYTDLGPEWQRVQRLDLSKDTLMALFATKPFDFAPGERYRYDNSGYYLLGVILEQVTGRTYQQLVEERLSRPLELADTRYCGTREIIPRRAQGYARPPDGFVNAPWISMTQPYSAGALCSTVLDLVRWTGALWAGRVVAQASLQAMTTPGRLNDGRSTGYGFGLVMDSLAGHFRVSHGGGINGFTSALAHFPDDGVTVAVLDNTGNVSPDQLADRLARVALGIPLPVLRDLSLTAAERARYTGTYALGTLTLRIFEQGDSLMAQATGQGADRLRSQGQHRFIASFDDAVRLDFEVTGDRATGFILHQGGRDLHAARVN